MCGDAVPSTRSFAGAWAFNAVIIVCTGAVPLTAARVTAKMRRSGWVAECAFLVVSAGVILFPGPSSLFLLAQGAGHGRRFALAATTGIETASAIRVMLAVTGLTAALASSAAAYEAVRWAGVGYLACLGVRAFLARPHRAHAASAQQLSLAGSARKGLLVGLGNPKMIIFYLAFLPQFIHPGQGSTTGQMLILGGMFWLLGTAWDLALACASATIGTWLSRRPRAQTIQPRLEGLTYLGLAGWAAITSS